MSWEEIVLNPSKEDFNNYKKLMGILAGVEYFPGCISPTKIGLVRSAEEWRKIAGNFSSEEVALRFDSKSGDVSQFISSQSVRTDMLGWYLEHPWKPTKGEEGQTEQQKLISLEEAGAIAIIEEFANMKLIDRVKTLGAFNISLGMESLYVWNGLEKDLMAEICAKVEGHILDGNFHGKRLNF